MSARPIADIVTEWTALVEKLPEEDREAGHRLIADTYECWSDAIFSVRDLWIEREQSTRHPSNPPSLIARRIIARVQGLLESKTH